MQDIHIALAGIDHLVKLLKKRKQFRILYVKSKSIRFKMGKFQSIQRLFFHLCGQRTDGQPHQQTKKQNYFALHRESNWVGSVFLRNW